MYHIRDNRACKIRDGHIGGAKHGEKNRASNCMWSVRSYPL